MNIKLLDYLRQNENKLMVPGIDCNSMAFNIIYILYYNENKNIKIIIDKLSNCKSFNEIRPIIKEHGSVHTILENLGWKQVEGKILPGDFLIKSRQYFDDVIYAIDSITFCGMAPLSSFDKKTQSFIISRDMHISKQHKIYRKGN
jgi:hypothetical protein